MHKHLESASLHPHFFHSHTLILELRCENKHPHSFGLKSTVINTGNSSVVQAWTQTFLFSHISLHIKKHKCTSDQFESRISVHLLSHFFTWLPLFTYSNNSKGTVSQRLWQHELSTLTSSLKRSWRLISERSRHCFCSCSSSESGCLKYSIRSFSVCSTSSTKLATSVDPPSAMLSRALRGKAHLWDYGRAPLCAMWAPLWILDKVGEEEGGVADDPSSAGLLVLAALQDKAVIHVPLRMQAGLKKYITQTQKREQKSWCKIC